MEARPFILGLSFLGWHTQPADLCRTPPRLIDGDQVQFTVSRRHAPFVTVETHEESRKEVFVAQAHGLPTIEWVVIKNEMTLDPANASYYLDELEGTVVEKRVHERMRAIASAPGTIVPLIDAFVMRSPTEVVDLAEDLAYQQSLPKDRQRLAHPWSPSNVIVTQYLPEHTNATPDHVAQGGSEERLIRLLISLLATATEMAADNIVHLDLTYRNILMPLHSAPPGPGVLIDFGAAMDEQMFRETAAEGWSPSSGMRWVEEHRTSRVLEDHTPTPVPSRWLQKQVAESCEGDYVMACLERGKLHDLGCLCALGVAWIKAWYADLPELWTPLLAPFVRTTDMLLVRGPLANYEYPTVQQLYHETVRAFADRIVLAGDAALTAWYEVHARRAG